MALAEQARTILVVEDDSSIAELISWALEDAGFSVRTASTITQALALSEQAAPDLVVADFLLPDGFGSELVAKLRRWGNGAPASLLISAHPRAHEHARSAGADACLSKPFDLDEFYAAVDRLLERVASVDGAA